LSKVVISDQYLEETNILTVTFDDGSILSYDLGQPIPDKIHSLVALDSHILEIEFTNEEKRRYNMTNRLTGVFSFLKDINEFKQVKLIQNGKAIGWSHQGETIDLWADSLYLHSYPTED